MKKLTEREKTTEQIAKRKRFGTLAIIISGTLFVVVMLIDSIARIKFGNLAMDYNYKYQPIGGPVVRLIFCIIVLPLMIVVVWRTFRSKPDSDKPDDDKYKDEPQNVVDKPWKCSKCGEMSEPQFDSCWKCGTVRKLDHVA
jgi:uncharacterized membrane protein